MQFLNFDKLSLDIFQSTEDEWRNIFIVGAAIYAGTALIFVIFGSGYVQKWNNIIDAEDKVQTQSDQQSSTNSKIDAQQI